MRNKITSKINNEFKFHRYKKNLTKDKVNQTIKTYLILDF
jgi:hypothetical protein